MRMVFKKVFFLLTSLIIISESVVMLLKQTDHSTKLRISKEECRNAISHLQNELKLRIWSAAVLPDDE